MFTLGEWTLKQMVDWICFIHFYKLLLSSLILGLIISFAFASGCAVVIVALQHKQGLTSKLQRLYEYAGITAELEDKTIDCDICGVIKCNRHLSTPNREQWRGLFIIKELDDALASVSIDLRLILHLFFHFPFTDYNFSFIRKYWMLLWKAGSRYYRKMKILLMH